MSGTASLSPMTYLCTSQPAHGLTKEGENSPNAFITQIFELVKHLKPKNLNESV